MWSLMAAVELAEGSALALAEPQSTHPIPSQAGPAQLSIEHTRKYFSRILSEGKSLPALDSFKGCSPVRAQLLVCPLLEDMKNKEEMLARLQLSWRGWNAPIWGEKMHFMFNFITLSLVSFSPFTHCTPHALKNLQNSLHPVYFILPIVKIFSLHEQMYC